MEAQSYYGYEEEEISCTFVVNSAVVTPVQEVSNAESSVDWRLPSHNCKPGTPVSASDTRH